jgi:hypothetical protein
MHGTFKIKAGSIPALTKNSIVAKCQHGAGVFDDTSPYICCASNGVAGYGGCHYNDTHGPANRNGGWETGA